MGHFKQVLADECGRALAVPLADHESALYGASEAIETELLLSPPSRSERVLGHRDRPLTVALSHKAQRLQQLLDALISASASIRSASSYSAKRWPYVLSVSVGACPSWAAT